MAWTTYGTKLLEHLGYDTEEVHKAADLLAMLFGVSIPDDEDRVVRVKLDADWCAWLATHSTGGEDGWHCVAVAPMGDLHDCHVLTMETLMTDKRWPETWKTALREGIKPTRERVAPIITWEGAKFAWAQGPESVRLARVVSVEPLLLQLEPDGPVLPATATYLPWKALHKDIQGMEAEFLDRQDFHNYKFLCMRIGRRRKNIELATDRVKETRTKRPKTEQAASRPVHRLPQPMLKGEIPLEQQLDAVTCTMTDGSSKLMSRADADVHGDYLRRLHASGWRFGMPIPDNV